MMDRPMQTQSEVKPSSGAYWGQLDPRGHAVQIYTNEKTLLDSLESFVGAAIRSQEAVVVIATAGHLHELEIRLRGSWINLDRERWEDRYVAVLAKETLERVCRNGNVDASAFNSVMGDLVRRARGKDNRRVRGFCEMVTLMWTEGRSMEALYVEMLWTRLQMAERFPLFCAYPRGLFKNGSDRQIDSICGAHDHVVPGFVA